VSAFFVVYTTFNHNQRSFQHILLTKQHTEYFSQSTITILLCARKLTRQLANLVCRT